MYAWNDWISFHRQTIIIFTILLSFLSAYLFVHLFNLQQQLRITQGSFKNIINWGKVFNPWPSESKWESRATKKVKEKFWKEVLQVSCLKVSFE